MSAEQLMLFMISFSLYFFIFIMMLCYFVYRPVLRPNLMAHVNEPDRWICEKAKKKKLIYFGFVRRAKMRVPRIVARAGIPHSDNRPKVTLFVFILFLSLNNLNWFGSHVPISFVLWYTVRSQAIILYAEISALFLFSSPFWVTQSKTIFIHFYFTYISTQNNLLNNNFFCFAL